MPALVGYLLLFVVVGVGFIFVHLLAGKLIRPAKPEGEKLTIYECGEPTIGSAWVQFDLRFYVVALLFVIFDVEVAFFFPWAVVFGKTNELARDDITIERRVQLTQELSELTPNDPAKTAQLKSDLTAELTADAGKNRAAANRFGWLAFIDILVFFGILLVGFAYLWKRGDLEWVRSVASEQQAARAPPPPPARREPLAVVETPAHAH